MDRHGIRTHRSSCRRYSAEDLLARARRSRTGRACRTASWAARRTTRPSFMATLGADPEFYAPFADSGAPLVPRVRREGAVPQPRADQPADRPRQAGARGRGRLRARRARDATTGSSCQRREDARDRLGDHARDVRRAEQRGARSRRARPRTTRWSSSRRWTRRARSSLCRRVVRGRARDVAVRPPALEPLRRERRGRRLRQRVHPVGERPRLPRRREGDRLLRASGFMQPLHAAVGHAARPSSSTSCAACSRAGLEANGTDGFRGVQAELGELVGWRNLHLGDDDGAVPRAEAGAGRQCRAASSSTRR